MLLCRERYLLIKTPKNLMLARKLLLALSFFMFTPIFILFSFAYFTGFSLPEMSQAVAVDASYTVADQGNRQAMVLGSYTMADAIPVVISNYLEHYHSPIPPEPVVKYADEYGIDPRLIVAIAQQESNLGKKMPESCHNAWGYGIHARGTLCFDNWDEGIRTVTKGIAEKYCRIGLCDDPCLMMKKYTPSSDGSWCFGVNQFLDEMRTGNF